MSFNIYTNSSIDVSEVILLINSVVKESEWLERLFPNKTTLAGFVPKRFENADPKLPLSKNS